MIFCDTGGQNTEAFDALAVFASQARAYGAPIVISDKAIDVELGAAHQFDFAPFISSARPNPNDHLILIAAESLTQEKANQIRAFTQGTPMSCTAYGAFPNRQAEITVSSRLAHAINQKPELVSLEETNGLPSVNIPIFGAPLASSTRERPNVALFFPDLNKPNVRETLRAINVAEGIDIEIITNGTEKHRWIDLDGYNVPAWHLGEMLPRALAARFEAVVFYEKPVSWPRFQMLVANFVHNGCAMIDATIDRHWEQHHEAFITGPVQLSDLPAWFGQSIRPNLGQIAATVRNSDLARQLSLPAAIKAMCVPTFQSVTRQKKAKPPVLFVPTNGVGLGHAKRCSLIADAMREKAAPKFAAFPSCIGMLNASGFDTVPLVSRTQKYASHMNDVVNFARLSAAAQDAKVTVFDGGYVFDSVMRAAAEHGRQSVWVRRGLWQASQNNKIALDRQKTFTRIVVPAEVFDELNNPIGRERNVVRVGPIVQHADVDPAQKERLRGDLQNQLSMTGQTLVVTMLGGGVAADRRAQVKTVCAHLENRSDVMHVLVVWPTATTDPSWFQYKNTRVVQSVHASALIPLADLFISAIGYNSFHEVIYGGVPTIFIPQMASFMDDQRARGQAAADREVAMMVEPWELLTLTKRIDECLGGHSEVLRQNLRSLNLPEPGARAAAEAILEVAQ